MALITCHAVLVQMYGRKDTLIATGTRNTNKIPMGRTYSILNFVTLSLNMSSVGANELASSIAISDRKLHAGMVDLDPTGP